MHAVEIIIFCSAVIGALGELTLTQRDAAKWASSPFENDTSIRPFTVTFSENDIKDLKTRLSDSSRTFVPSLQGVGFEYGFNSKLLPEWRSYWANQYNFTARLAYINQYPQFKTNIQGTDVHFVRVIPQNTGFCEVLPLLILHSFPSTFLEFYKVVPRLTTCVNGIAFEVILPSIPGYGFSDPPTKVGFGAAEAATVMKNLMKRIGHPQFFLASGDITHVGAMMATLYPHVVLGFFANNLVSYNPLSWGLWVAGALSPSLLADKTYQNKMYPLGSTITSFLAETGFVHILATRPDAIGVAMNESPTGMMAFILQVSQWLANNASVYQPDGGLGLVNRDEALDSVNIYWFSNCLTSAGRLYSETFNNRTYQEEIYARKTHVPTWIITANSSAITQAPAQYAIKYKYLLQTTYLDKYGLFLANQAPDYYANSIHNAVSFMQAFHLSNVNTNSDTVATISSCSV